jgi:hypothetical protein
MKELFYERQLKRLVSDMSDEIGLVQHSQGAVPNPVGHGYSVDDVSRGLVVLSRVYPDFDDKGVHNAYLGYIKDSQRSDLMFHNFYEIKNGKWGWRDEGTNASQDCFGRVMWALAEFTGSQYSMDEKKEAEKIFLEHLDFIPELENNLSKAFTLLGLSDYVLRTGNRGVRRITEDIAEDLARKFHKNTEDREGWAWFSDKMTYCNPKLPHPMINAGYALKNREIIDIGKRSLDFLIASSFDEKGIFHAIGNNGWFLKGEEPAKYDQQTVEAGDMVEACVDAFKILGHEKYKECAKRAFDWFNGRNITRKSIIDPVTGGVYDAITENGINTNQGAESILSYLLAATKLEEIESEKQCATTH